MIAAAGARRPGDVAPSRASPPRASAWPEALGQPGKSSAFHQARWRVRVSDRPGKSGSEPGPAGAGAHLNQVSTTVTQSSFRLGPPGPGPGCRAQSPSRTRKARRESLRDVDYDSHRDGGRLGLTGMIHLKCHGPRHGQLRLSHGHGCRNGRRRRQNRDAAGGKNCDSDEPRDLFIFFSKR